MAYVRRSCSTAFLFAHVVAGTTYRYTEDGVALFAQWASAKIMVGSLIFLD